MRTIKFRGKSIHTGDWLYGDLIHYENNRMIMNPKSDLLSDLENVDPATVGQFTGLVDKNGVEIYEHDILQWVSSNPFSIGEIRKVKVYYIEAQYWCNGSIGVYLAELLCAEKCEVIGNIHDNPELL